MEFDRIYQPPTRSRLATYAHSALGSVLRSLDERLSESISIKDLGGKAVSTFDNSAACARIAAALPNGGTLLLPEGDFRYATGFTLPVGVNIVGAGRACSSLTYTGSGDAITLADTFGVAPFHNRTVLRGFQLKTTAAAASVGPGLIGVKLVNAAYVVADDFECLRFSTAGINFHSTSAKATLYITARDTHIRENTMGILVTGVACNAVSIFGCSVRANVQWNIRSGIDVRAWTLHGNSFEGAGAGAVFIDLGYGISIVGNYFEQSVSGTPAVQLANSIEVGGVSITGNHMQGPNDGTGIILGNTVGPAPVYGVDVAGNFLTGWTVGVNPKHVIGGRIGPNRYSFVTTPVLPAGSGCTGLVVHEATSITHYGAPVTELTWSGAAWV